MTEVTVANLQDIFEGDISLENYPKLRDAALRSDANSRLLEEMARDLEPKGSTMKALKKGIAFWILGRTSHAVDALKKAHPSLEMASLFLGKAYLDMDRPADAKRVYRESLVEHEDSRAIAYSLVYSILRLGDFEEAKGILDRAIERFGENLETTFLGGYYLELTGEYDDARDAYEKVLESMPEHPQALFRLARWNQTWGDEERAIELYEKLRQHSPTYVNALLNLGNVYEDFQRYDQAIECYQEVLEAIPGHSQALQFLMDARASKTMFYDEEGERRADRQSAILKIPVTDFELSVRSRNCLNKMNIRTLGDLIQMTEQDLLAHKNFGETSLLEVKQMLAQKGLRLGQGKMEGSFTMAPAPVEISEEVLGQHIDSLNLSVRSRKCMERLGITSVGQLVSRTEAELLSAKNFGQTSLAEIKARLEEHGLRLKDVPY